MHTHFGSATHAVGVFLSVILVGTLWRVGWSYGVRSKNQHVAGLSRAAMTQF